MAAAFPNPADLTMLGIDFAAPSGRDQDAGDGPTHCQFEMVPSIARHDGALYGGTAIAASVVAMEAASHRPALWVTTQYISTARQGETVELTSEVLANGRNISQMQVIARRDDQVVFISIGSTATPRFEGLEGQFQQMPAMMPPEDAPEIEFAMPGGFRGFLAQVEYRSAIPVEESGGAPSLAMWARLRNGTPFTRAGLAFVADMVPGAIAKEAGFIGGGVSLDNSLRFGALPPETDWVLLEMQGHMVHGAHGHGSVIVWSRHGDLLAVGGQSANMGIVVPPPALGKVAD